MKNLDENEFQIRKQSFKLGYKFYSGNQLFPYKGIKAVVIECRLNLNIALRYKKELTFDEIH